MSDAPELTPRTCRWCRTTYVAPKGERWAGCRQCCPTLYDATAAGHGAPGEPETSRGSVDGHETPGRDYLPDLPQGEFDWDNVLCNLCRASIADGLYEGEPLCIACTERLLDRLGPGVSKLEGLAPAREWPGPGFS